MKAEARVTKIKGKKVPVEIVEPFAPRTIVGICPDCGGVVRGMPLGGCATAESGRIY